MKAFILALALFSFSAVAQPIGPLPPSSDTLNGDAAGRQAYVDLIVAYLKDRINYEFLVDYTAIQNENPSRVLTLQEVEALAEYMESYKTELCGVCATCSNPGISEDSQ